ncbi:hypothetical protein Pmar_PMAR014524 [Perkinsus marinus ATCC 50983]|uniref:PPM-type phosphatase domain-containing protein n=1 Tax=Perkinsus marinus (strain ATCC 50983 / TXsc) TaxID=423536 RepID=C5KWB2_PERM5|nr:hypothetical protein Pmar_PMAR014524 [Perkinsus marinus ATCC 50983]EER11223.1 hypothetical protein Pmar_PMAR014524 [Perkinsus marinus ATCC 50983]|eukprot:XP_002779428.1 hypothetical protein Pmar_PMAR014524 [Perkinsus marinus ATCC 50983]
MWPRFKVGASNLEVSHEDAHRIDLDWDSTQEEAPSQEEGSFAETPLSNGKYKVRIMNAGDSLHWAGDMPGSKKDLSTLTETDGVCWQPHRRADKQKCIAVPEVKEVVGEAGDRVVLACIGVFDVMSNEDVAREIIGTGSWRKTSAGSDLAEIASEILQFGVETRDFGLEEQQGELQLGRYSSVHSSALDMAEKYQVFFSEAVKGDVCATR